MSFPRSAFWPCPVPSTQAIDVGGLEVGGYVDSVLNIKDDGSTTAVNFGTTANLTFGYSIDSASAYLELEYDADGEAIDVENAVISYAVSEQATINMGKFDSWLGWEGLDAPDLWRTNLRYTIITFPDVEMNGVSIDFAVSEEIAAGIAVVDALNGNDTPTDTNNLGFGGYLTYTAEGIGSFDFDIAVGQEYAGADDEDLVFFSANGTIDALADDGFTLAYDLILVDYVEEELEIMVAANYALAEDAMGFPASVTGMYTLTDNGVDTDSEFAFGLLTNPTGNANFAINAEVNYIALDSAEDDTFGFYLEALAIIP